MCDKIQKVADKFTVPLVQVNNFIRNAVANGISSAVDLYKLAIRFIVEKWNNVVGDRNTYKRSIGNALHNKFLFLLLKKSKYYHYPLPLDQEYIKAKVIEAIEMYMDATNDSF